jgi:uncharacterized hydrophobic protein (TIGR00271 family)
MDKGFFLKLVNLFGGGNTPAPTAQEQASPAGPAGAPGSAGKVRAAREGLADVRERVTARTHEVRDMFVRVIQPEERTLKNYLSAAFWKSKRAEYARLREKEKQDLNVFSVLQEGALPTIEYYILTILSCVIATTGLLQGSTATIIGAMIVAPLMTPILAFSLGVIWGKVDLIRTSAQSIVKGVILAIAISALISFMVPIPAYTSEILARTRPTLFDIIVAIASGIVGAYGNANKKISNTLAGVAIAVALMPPLCTVGIGIGTFNREVATGASLLFLINLVSISLAGAAVFWAMKIHPTMEDAGAVKKRALYQIVISAIILLLISIPVGLYMREGYLIATAEQEARKLIDRETPGVEIFRMTTVRLHDGYHLALSIISDSVPDEAVMTGIRRQILEKHPHIKRLSIRHIPGVELP